MASKSIETPGELIAFAMSFIEPRAVQVACMLNVFTFIAQGICTSQALAEQVNGNADALTRLLLVCASLGLVYQDGETWRLTPIASRHLVANQPGYLGHVFTMSARSFHSFDQLPAYIASGEPIAPPPHRHSTAAARDFVRNSWAMGRVQADYVLDVIEPYKLSPQHTVLDIGAGSGIYAVPFLTTIGTLRYIALDLPHIVDIAQEEFFSFGKQIAWFPGNIFADGCPDVAFDVALLASFIHGFSVPQVQQLLVQIYHKLPAEGLLIIQDHFLRPDPTNPGMAALFNLNIALHNAHGGVQTLQAMELQLRHIGFTKVDIFDPETHPGLMPVIVAVK